MSEDLQKGRTGELTLDHKGWSTAVNTNMGCHTHVYKGGRVMVVNDVFNHLLYHRYSEHFVRKTRVGRN